MADISKNILNHHSLVRAILLLALSLATVNAVFAAQISGFVWLDNDLNGIQDTGEPGFAQTVPGFGAPNIALYATGSIELIEFIPLDEASSGQYSFNNVADGDYYVCVSNEFLELGLTVTTPNAGDDAIDSDFDFSPCSYDISVSGEQVVERDLGFVDNTTEVTEAGSIDVSVAVDHDGDGVVHFRFPEVPDIILELYSNEDGRLIKSALSQSAFGFTPDPDFHNIPVGSYFICASRNVIEDGEPVIRPAEATIPNIGSNVGDSEFSDSDFITQAEGSVCTDAISVQTGTTFRVGLGLSPSVIKPIVVNEFCTLDDALISAVRAIPLRFCPSGSSQSIHEGTVFLQENSHHGTIVAPGFPGAGNSSTATVTGLGQGAFADVVEAHGVSNSDSFADLKIENLSIKVAKALGANLTITNSTIEDDLIVGEFCCSRVKIENSTICGVYVESLSIVYNSGNPTQSTLSLNPCTGTNSGTDNEISGFVWMDTNGDGLQNNGELGFARTVPGFGAPNVALYPTGSTELIAFLALDESSNGHYLFENVPNGNYYVCVSNQFLEIGLSVTTPDAGNDAIDSDFDFSPCSYDISVTNNQVVKRDLGLTGEAGQPTDPVDPTDPEQSAEPGQISGFVWLDSNGNGLQDADESAFTQTIPGFDPLTVAIYPEGSTNPVQSVFLGDNSAGRYQFNNVPAGNYYVCTSRLFEELGLSVTTQNAGNDSIDSDFDFSGCSFGVTVSSNQGAVRDMGLAGQITPNSQPGTGAIKGIVWVDRDKSGLREDRLSLPNSEVGVESIILELYSMNSAQPIATTVSSVFSGDQLALTNQLLNLVSFQFENLEAGTYVVCALVIPQTSVTIQNAGDEIIDNDFNSVTGCTNLQVVVAQHDTVVDLGLVVEPGSGPLFVNESCSLQSAIKAATFGVPVNGCQSGVYPGEDTIILAPDSQHSSLRIHRVPFTSVVNKITIEGNGASIDQINPNLFTGGASLILNNVSVDEINVTGNLITINDSTVVSDLKTIEPGVTVTIGHSTICGVFVDQLNFSHETRHLNPCL